MKETLHIYTRVSSIQQETKGMSLQEQRSIGIKVSKRLGMDYKVWNEGGKSSYTDNLLNRPVLLELINGFKDGSVKHIYVKDFDRLSRKSVGWYVILRDIEKYKISVYVGEGSPYDMDNEYDKLMMTIMSGVTQFDNEQRKKRLHTSKIRKFNEGYYIHSKTPYGYEKYDVGVGKMLKSKKGESTIVKNIFSMFSKGRTVKEIQSHLLKKKIPSPEGGIEWGLQTIHHILKSKIYIGETSFFDKSTQNEHLGECVPLIDTKTFLTVQNRYETYRNVIKQSSKQRKDYLLTEFLFCGVCGYKMRGKKNPQKYENRYYCGVREEKWNRPNLKDCCSIPKSKSVNIDRLDELVWNEVLGTLKESKVLREMEKSSIMNVEGKKGKELIDLKLKEISKEKRKLIKERITLQKKQSKLSEFWLNGNYEEEEFHRLFKISLKKLMELDSQIEELNIYMSRINESNTWVDWLKIYMKKVDNWKHLTSTKLKKELLRHYIQKITVEYNPDKMLHNVVIHLRLHLFGDELVITKKSVKGVNGREYYINKGSKKKSVYLSKTKVGRKPKNLGIDNNGSSGEMLNPNIKGDRGDINKNPLSNPINHL